MYISNVDHFKLITELPLFTFPFGRECQLHWEVRENAALSFFASLEKCAFCRRVSPQDEVSSLPASGRNMAGIVNRKFAIRK
jgi:hypothetical protein